MGPREWKLSMAAEATEHGRSVPAISVQPVLVFDGS